ncbi:Pycsar system effector family protein [Chthonobacter rhizosphaerae]|uniref:Pycsar system effector family protein n=1 Tax=Chthonobacter rhizosphaerae TaxID=2735553 RepID=UPI0015EE43D7|nr:Pycsar system effector family protein [Chthonobacter rhizosphaerae]
MATKDEYFDHLKEVNRTFYDQVRGADQKAAYIFTFMLALLIWSSEARDMFTLHRYVGAPLPVIACSALAAVSLLTAAMAAILVVMPRRREGGSSLFWGSWDASSLALKEAEARGDLDFLMNEYRTNITHLAAICRTKYRLVALAFRALAVALLAHFAVLAIS